MSEIATIREQLESAYRGPAWHGPALREVLQGVTAEQAAARPVSAAHTIAELVRHVAAWKSIVRRRLAGEPLEQVTGKQDWPAAPEGNWQRSLEELEREHQALLAALAGLDRAALERTVGDAPARVCLTGTAHHDLYHAGQVALLKRALT